MTRRTYNKKECRKKEIVWALQKCYGRSVEQLSKRLKVSDDTVRRYLKELEEEGKVYVRYQTTANFYTLGK